MKDLTQREFVGLASGSAECSASGRATLAGAGYAGFGGGDFSTAYAERGEIYDAVRDAGVTGFVTVSGDRHSFWAGYASKVLPPRSVEPIGVAFITGSISAPGLVEALEHNLPQDLRLRALYDAAECEFVCIPRPLERSEEPNGGPVLYRLVHRCRIWRPGERSTLEQQTIEGDPGLGL